MVQGASQVAGRFPDLMHMYKAPPPEISSEHFYETDRSRGFARGFSIQTVGPQPIAWAEHVLANGHWGHALREYLRDYNHWFVLGVLSELLPQPGNRVTLAAETDAHGMPVARMDYSQCDNDRDNVTHAKGVLRQILDAAGAQDQLTIDRYAHLVGGCRMGTSPEASVVDADHRVWGTDNLFVADGSVMPTQGAANPRTHDHGARVAPGGPLVPAVIRARAYRVPTDAPEGDGTLEWDSTSVVVVEAGEGLGYTYADPAVARLVNATLAPVLGGFDLGDVGACWMRMRRALRQAGSGGLAAMAISAVDIALWDRPRPRTGAPGRGRARRVPGSGPRLRLRRLHHLRRPAAPRPTPRLGDRRHPAREDEGRGRPGAGSAPRRRRPRSHRAGRRAVRRRQRRLGTA